MYFLQFERGWTTRLKRLTNAAITSAIAVSLYYAAGIRRGRRRPHPRHWMALAQMCGVELKASVSKKGLGTVHENQPLRKKDSDQPGKELLPSSAVRDCTPDMLRPAKRKPLFLLGM